MRAQGHMRRSRPFWVAAESAVISLNRQLNSNQFTFLKYLNRTYGSKVTVILSFQTHYQV